MMEQHQLELASTLDSQCKYSKTIRQLVIYTGVLVRVFYSQTICVGIKYVDAWFITLKFKFFYQGIFRDFKVTT